MAVTPGRKHSTPTRPCRSNSSRPLGRLLASLALVISGAAVTVGGVVAWGPLRAALDVWLEARQLRAYIGVAHARDVGARATPQSAIPVEGDAYDDLLLVRHRSFRMRRVTPAQHRALDKRYGSLHT